LRLFEVFEKGCKKKWCTNSIFFIFFFFVTIFFFGTRGNRAKEMQDGEGEGLSAPGCGGAAGKQLAHDQTDLDAAEERIFEHMRILAERNAVFIAFYLTWFALVRLMRTRTSAMMQ